MSIALSSVAAFTAAVAGAHRIDFASYTLAGGSVRDALETAARSGAWVRVRLEREPFDDPAATLHRANAKSLACLAAAGADAALTRPGEPVLHLKAAVVDGVAWLDDRNWAGPGSHATILRDDEPGDVAALGVVLAGGPAVGAQLATTKAEAQRRELDVVRAAGSAPLALATESFGTSEIAAALLARASAGGPTRLLVAGREAAEQNLSGKRERVQLAKLAALGVEVRTSDPAGRDGDEKLAVTAGVAWVGSANATFAHGASGKQRDWGLAIREPQVVDGLRAAFEADWQAARRLRP